jgi:hypothetical protein
MLDRDNRAGKDLVQTNPHERYYEVGELRWNFVYCPGSHVDLLEADPAGVEVAHLSVNVAVKKVLVVDADDYLVIFEYAVYEFIGHIDESQEGHWQMTVIPSGRLHADRLYEAGLHAAATRMPRMGRGEWA